MNLSWSREAIPAAVGEGDAAGTTGTESRPPVAVIHTQSATAIEVNRSLPTEGSKNQNPGSEPRTPTGVSERTARKEAEAQPSLVHVVEQDLTSNERLLTLHAEAVQQGLAPEGELVSRDATQATRRRKPGRWSESPVFVLFLLPAVLFLAFTSVYPLARTFWLSFHTWYMNKPNTSPQWVGLGEYQNTLADGVFRTSALNTAVFGVGTVAVEIVLGLALALALTSGGGGIKIARSILLVPMIMTPVVVGVLWRILYYDKGLVNYLLSLVGLGPVFWFVDPTWAFIGVMLVEHRLELLSAIADVPLRQDLAVTVQALPDGAPIAWPGGGRVTMVAVPASGTDGTPTRLVMLQPESHDRASYAGTIQVPVQGQWRLEKPILKKHSPSIWRRLARAANWRAWWP